MFIGPSPAGAGAFDLTQILPPSAPIVRGDELWFYYTGLKYRASFRYVGAYPKGKMLPKTGLDRAAGAICLAVLRRDGFVSLDAGAASGRVVSKPFVPPAGQLHVNADLGESGRLQVAMLAADGRVIAHSQPIVGDQLRSVVHWVKPLANQPAEQAIRLRFTLNNGSLYSFWYDQPAVDSTGGAQSND